ncbi:divalent-cation tolerance protein CutA [Aporhodopirellula aestuarii]|uniref:Divalent-cation tolerance protein CutA n=1 Tax=Aporhodopirellula aestuarii TaxID=2950107 RepID=A0ABT0U877_9BACT|nr:divalent-cation tolerance protein CutA [Aporhodopirellula aestuarii]MCM2373117.1 divalent-cation tolerance protein CutA [Aporhodopirellula aestuarii]
MSENNSQMEALAIVWTTVDKQETARRLASSMLEKGLAACVQIDSPVESHYRWEGRLHVDQEYRLIIKTRAALSSPLMEWLAENHPYDEPQILVTQVTAASPGYASWVAEQTGA